MRKHIIKYMKKTNPLFIRVMFALSACILFPATLAAKNRNPLEFDAIALLDSTFVKVNSTGSGTFAIRKVVKINTHQGALNYRVVKYDYDPLTAFAEFKDMKVYKADGSIKTIDVSTACDYAAPARAIYWGARQIMIEPGLLEPGDILDYEINKSGFTYALLTDENEDRFIPPMRGQFYDIVPFWVSEPTLKKIYQVSFPLAMPMQYEFYQGEAQSSVHFDGDRKIYSFTKLNVFPFEREPNMVDLFDAAPKLMMSSTPTWYEKSEWFYRVNEDYGSFDAYEPAQKKVDELLKGTKTQMEKIAILTHWVADNMRYSGISMGEGEGFTLHNTKMNFDDRCGVCKDKAALLISMLRMAGMEAYPAMTMAGSRIEAIPADHFNHSVAVVKLENGTYMPLDPTWVPFTRELWSSAEQQQHYLPGIPEKSDLLLTPLSPPEDHFFKLNVASSIDAQGTLKGTFTMEAEGQTDRSVRNPFTVGFAVDWHKVMEAELMNISPDARLTSVDWGKNPRNYVAAPLKITMKFEVPNYANVGSDVLIFKPVVFTNLYASVRSFLRFDLRPEERKYGFKDACSRLVVLNESLTLPKGYKMLQTADTKETSSEAADFNGYLKQENNTIKIHQVLTLKKRVYEASDWKGFRDAVSAYNSFANKEIIAEK